MSTASPEQTSADRRAHPGTPPSSLVIEHGFLVGREQRAWAIRLGIPCGTDELAQLEPSLTVAGSRGSCDPEVRV